METRKVQLSGGTTYTVSLPKRWAEEHRISAGSELRLHPGEDGSLLIEAAERDDGKWRSELTIDDLNDRELRETVDALYLIGVDTIVLVDRAGGITDRMRTIREIVRKLAGFELLETGERSVTLQSLISADHISIEKNATRLKIVALAMHEDAVNAVLHGDDALATQVIERDSEADKSFARVTRCFQRTLTDLGEVERLGHGRPTLFEYYHLCRQLERVADHAEKIARLTRDHLEAPDTMLTEEFTELSVSTRTIIKDATDVLLTDADVSLAYRSLAKRDTVVERIETLDRTLYDSPNVAQAYIGGLLLDSLKRSAEYGANIAELGLQRHCRDVPALSPQ